MDGFRVSQHRPGTLQHNGHWKLIGGFGPSKNMVGHLGESFRKGLEKNESSTIEHQYTDLRPARGVPGFFDSSRRGDDRAARQPAGDEKKQENIILPIPAVLRPHYLGVWTMVYGLWPHRSAAGKAPFLYFLNTILKWFFWVFLHKAFWDWGRPKWSLLGGPFCRRPKVFSLPFVCNPFHTRHVIDITGVVIHSRRCFPGEVFVSCSQSCHPLESSPNHD